MYPKMSAPTISVKVPGSMNMKPAMIRKMLSSKERGLLKNPIIPAERAITPKKAVTEFWMISGTVPWRRSGGA
jgi:hypothetical protein